MSLPIAIPAPNASMKRATASSRLGLYGFLSRPHRGPRSYIGKIFLVAFLGTHIPLLALLAHFIVINSLSAQATTQALLVALVATLAGTGLTLFALTQLLKPILLTRQGLHQYLSTNTIPDLPTEFADDAGGLMTDTQHAIEKLDEVIVHLSHYDALTALPNKSLFEERIKMAVAEARRSGSPLAVLMVDVQGLKAINDLYGIQIGDRLLKTVANRFSQAVREADTLSRIGGDEFALLQTEVKSVDNVIAQAQRLTDVATCQPIKIDDLSIHVSVSIGVALYPCDDPRIEGLLRDAEAAMYQAKARNETGAEPCQFYSPEMNEKMREMLAVDKDLREALQKGEFILHYQPQVDFSSGCIIGMEALLRWNHPERGMVSPAEFIPLAEKNGLIVEIGEWVLRTACQQNKAWQDAGLSPVRMAVNLSARQFHHPTLVECVAQTLQETALDAKCLELEITESLAIGNEAKTICILHRLHEMGIALALDDFGTGYSSLSQLTKFPLDTLKIDRAFLNGVSSSDATADRKDNATLVTGIIGLAHNLQMSVVAEGVETTEQADFLKARGCETLQGFLFSRPVSAAVATTLLQQEAARLPKRNSQRESQRDSPR